ncbi:Rne/Rng family ribonuclease [Thermodesulforhabdus norvegica]|uniref:Ribonuclease G n=1 Tax=Thermodesulforhabdus norvegica TaxID=39841 RepID=A0A1I4S427_9BACT|nr:Rne/Rng family ribonuclease [Thermodesulforhabdus norvegica]SFM59252.1 ribonuclease E [Thermodesulforhabdus norvegica]
MSNQLLLINALYPEEFRIAIVEGFNLEGFFIETASQTKHLGNIYKGIVEQIQPSLQAAFVNIGLERNGFLPLDEIHPEYFAVEPVGQPRIQDLLQPGQEVLVQVVKEGVGNKGPALTTYISLAGRYVVLMPGSNQRAVSRKISDEEQKERLRRIAQELTLPDEFGIILRTAAAYQTKRAIIKDLKYLLRIWENIREKTVTTPAPALIYKERSLVIRVVRDYLTPDIKRIIVDQKDVCREVKDFLKIITPRHQHIVELHKHDTPIFSHYGIESQIEQIFHKRVSLPSGGYIVIEPTEALVAIDVNSGRATSERDPEETSFRVNLEAAVEIPRQLRLRDLGGLIVIDFIDMNLAAHKAKVEQTLREALRKDKAKVSVGRISRFGILEMSRQHLGVNVQFGTYRECPYCNGSGMVQTPEAAALAMLRKIWNYLCQGTDFSALQISTPPDVAHYLLNQKRPDLRALEKRYGVQIHIFGDPSLKPHESTIKTIGHGEGNDLWQAAHSRA